MPHTLTESTPVGRKRSATLAHLNSTLFAADAGPVGDPGVAQRCHGDRWACQLGATGDGTEPRGWWGPAGDALHRSCRHANYESMRTHWGCSEDLWTEFCNALLGTHFIQTAHTHTCNAHTHTRSEIQSARNSINSATDRFPLQK